MKILITGGAGYIGSHVVHHVLKQGYTPVVIDDFSTGIRSFVPDEVSLYEGSCGDKKTLSRVFSENKISAIIHLAASTKVEESVRNPQKYYQNNTVNSLSLIEEAVRYNVRKFIYSSTAAVYGNVETEFVTENSTLAPCSPYGESKLAVEKILKDFSEVKSLEVVILRYFNVAGASSVFPIGQATRDATNLIKVACEVATGKRPILEVYGDDYPTYDGTCVRDYIHVEDIALAHLLALQNNSKKFEILNCGYNRGYSVLEVIQALEKVSQRKLNVKIASKRAGDITKMVADNSKIRENLGWKPQYDDLSLICKTAYEWEIAQDKMTSL